MIHDRRQSTESHAADHAQVELAHDASAPFFAADGSSSGGGQAPGAMIGRYRIVREIGAGGMGVVYEATRDDLHRRVALKTLHGAARTGSLERLQREAETLARLDHPGIAKVIDAFPDGERFCIVMDLVEGRPITEIAADLSVREKLRLFLDVCRAVEHANLRGVAHRDLKPTNILVGSDRRPVVLDFGLARLVEEGDHGRVTQTGQLVGTLAYMSPEQASGDDAAIDVRSDVYSLGVVLYEMLTGALPIDVATGSVVRAVHAIVLAPPTPPSRRNAALKGDLEQILLKALEKNVRRRYESAAALARDIERHLEHRPIAARPATPMYRASRYVRRHRALVLGAGAAILALSVGLAIAATQMVRARDAEQRATERFNDVRSLANMVIFDLHDAIENLQGATGARAMLVESALRHLDRLSRDPPANDPGFRIELARSYVRLGDALYGYGRGGLGRAKPAFDAYGKAMNLLVPPGGDAESLSIDARRVFARAMRGANDTVDPQSPVPTDITVAEASHRVVEHWRSVTDSPEAMDEDRKALAEALRDYARQMAKIDLDEGLASLEEVEFVLGSLPPSSTRYDSAEVAFIRGEMLQLHQKHGAAVESLDRAASLLRPLLAADASSRQVRRRLLDVLLMRMLAGSFLFDPSTEARSVEVIELTRQLCATDPTDRRAVRSLELAHAFAGESMANLAQEPGGAIGERGRLLARAITLTTVASEIVLERRDRGELPVWESHYPADFLASLEGYRSALRALESPATPTR